MLGMEKYFNTTGPVDARYHYCLPPLQRLDMEDVLRLIAQMRYFVLHAPRQTGKTSVLLALQEYLNARGDVRALYVNVEGGQAARENMVEGIATIVRNSAAQAQDRLGDDRALILANEILAVYGPTNALSEFLRRWCNAQAKPTVLLIDEIDTLIGDTLVAVLRQLRAGYTNRPEHFPSSVILCGVRDVHDYRLQGDDGKPLVTGGSAFNISAKSLRLGNFVRQEIETLYQQHTATTGQAFVPDAIELVWQLTNGQPWLVNALANEVCFEMKAGRDRSLTISTEMIQQAKENLILRRVTHLDQLTDKLKEARVRRVIEAVLSEANSVRSIPPDDVDYVRDLGLIRTAQQIVIANPIYQEIIPRTLTYSTQLTISESSVWYVRPDHSLDMEKLLAAFQQFFRENVESWLERFDYKEAGPQLLLQAFLQRIVNGGGAIVREYGLGRGRTDLLVIWPLIPDDSPYSPNPHKQRAVIELKLLHKTLEKTISEGIVQTRTYMESCGASEGHLVVFDRTSQKPWSKKIFKRVRAGITVWGM